MMKHRTRNVEFKLIPNERPHKHLDTAFQRECDRLGLDEEDYPAIEQSKELRLWVQSNKNSKFVPERLLSHWGLQPEVYL